MAQGRYPCKGFSIVTDHINAVGEGAVIRCYAGELRDKGHEVDVIGPGEVTPGKRIMVFNEGIASDIEQKFEIDSLEHFENYRATLMLVRGLKQGMQ